MNPARGRFLNAPPPLEPASLCLCDGWYGLRALRGARAAELRGWPRLTGIAIDPWNLIWVMPAEEDVEPGAIIFAGGDPVCSSDLPPLPHRVLVIAADSGLDSARRLGISVDLAVGDFDSADPSAVAAAAAAGTLFERHPVDKDASDLELGLEAALRRGLSPVMVVGGGGGRFDHLLANAALLGAARYAPLRLRWLMKGTEVVAIHDRVEIGGSPGDLLTLLAANGPAAGVTTTGLRWRLVEATLEPGSTRGLSNEFSQKAATVSVGQGALLAIHTPRTP
jgi:thiamine pyrophosphokinase